MGLRKQLLLVSFVTLALPWAGLQMLHELEKALTEGQQNALGATARALSEVVAASDIAPGGPRRPQASQQPLVLHPLPSRPVLDGYFDDWRARDWQPGELRAGDGQPSALSGQYFAGEIDGLAVFYLSVGDASREFFNPSQRLERADHVALHLPGRGALRLYSAAPGQLSASWQTGAAEHAVKGYWHESGAGYELEWQMPLTFLEQGVHIGVHDGALGRSALASVNVEFATVRQYPRLKALIERFVEPGMRVYLVDRAGYLLADAGQLAGETAGAYRGFVYSLVKTLLGKDSGPAWHEAGRDGHLTGVTGTPLATQLLGQSALLRQKERINRAYAPLDEASFEGFVVVDKNSNSVDALVTGVTGTVFFYSLMVSLFAGVVCIGYASILSFRIRKLSKAVEQAMDAQGKPILTAYGSRAQDEIGELARNYGQLVQKLKDYTDYLQSLSAKLSHELRTPLAIIKSSIENLQQTPLSDQGALYAERAVTGADRLGGMLQAMSAANRLEQSLQNAQAEYVDLQAMFREWVLAYEGAYASHRFRLQLAPGEQWQAWVAPELIAQMMDKLIENAVAFAPEASEIEITVAPCGREWRLQVANRGPAIAEHQLKDIFDSMFSARTDTDAQGHLGLGLYMVRLIVQHHGGRVRAFNDPKTQKVVFELVLPGLR